MTTGNTSLLKLALPVEGELDGAWGNVVNNSITSLLDTAVAGATTLTTDTDVILSDTALAANQSRQAIILWTATGSATRYITAPARSKSYIVINATGGSQSIVIRGSGPTTGVTVVAGRKALVAWNGSDFVEVAGGKIDLTSDVTGVLPIANGGTNLSSYTTGDIVYASNTNVLSKLPIGSPGQVLSIAAGVPSWTAQVQGLPSQTGNAGKYLTTDGSTASWSATGAAANGSIYINNQVVSSNYTIAAGTNGFSVGPITVNSGVTVTVSSGQRWVVI